MIKQVPKISQSLIKNYYDYKAGNSCGLLFAARYIDHDPDAEMPPTEAMKVGTYFEYLCTGALPRNGIKPEPDISYKGKTGEKLSAPYQRAKESAELFKKIIRNLGIIIQKVGMVLQDDEMNGIIDIYANWGGEDVFIDLKYTGLIDDKWNDMGWNLETLRERDKLLIQGVQYKILADRCLKIQNIPFYYFVFSSLNVNNVRIIKQEVDESRTQSHIVNVHDTISALQKDMYYGFKAYPNFKRCYECPIATKCTSKIEVPLIDVIEY